MSDIWNGIIIGGAGGFVAGLAVSFIGYAHTKMVELVHKWRIFEWLKDNTSNEDGNQYRSTRAIASWNNLTEDRARYICSIHNKIFLSTGQKEDMWSLYERGDRSVYENRGVRKV